MAPAKFSYIIPVEERTTVQVTKGMHRILKMAAKERGMTLVTLVYFALCDGLSLMIKKENVKDAVLISNLLEMYRENQKQKRKGISNR